MVEAEQRTPMVARIFRAPVSLPVVLLALAGWTFFRLGVALFGYLIHREELFARFTGDLLRSVSPMPGTLLEAPIHIRGPLEPALFLVILLYGLGIWAFFGVAACRVAAVRIARDEIVSFTAALRFAWQTKFSNLLYPTILLLLLFFLVIANGLAGLVAGIPWVGPLFLIPLLPLVLLSSLIFALVAFGGILGLGVATSALATERNGTLDAVSRTYSYVFSRPVYFLFAVALALLVARLLYWVGHHVFLDTAIGSLGILYESGSLQEVLDAAVRGIRGFERLDVTQWIGAAFVWCVVGAVRLTITAVVIGYLLSASTYIYFLLREEVDGVPFDDIDLGLRADEAVDSAPIPLPQAPPAEGPSHSPSAAPEADSEAGPPEERPGSEPDASAN